MVFVGQLQCFSASQVGPLPHAFSMHLRPYRAHPRARRNITTDPENSLTTVRPAARFSVKIVGTTAADISTTKDAQFSSVWRKGTCYAEGVKPNCATSQAAKGNYDIIF